MINNNNGSPNRDNIMYDWLPNIVYPIGLLQTINIRLLANGGRQSVCEPTWPADTNNYEEITTVYLWDECLRQMKADIPLDWMSWRETSTTTWHRCDDSPSPRMKKNPPEDVQIFKWTIEVVQADGDRFKQQYERRRRRRRSSIPQWNE